MTVELDPRTIHPQRPREETVQTKAGQKALERFQDKENGEIPNVSEYTGRRFEHSAGIEVENQVKKQKSKLINSRGESKVVEEKKVIIMDYMAQ